MMFQAASGPHSGAIAVHRLWNPRTGDLVWINNPKERISAVSRFRYVDQGVQFYARWANGPGCIPIHRLLKGSIHRYALADEVRELSAAGWRNEGVAFFAAPAATISPEPVEPSSTTPSSTAPGSDGASPSLPTETPAPSTPSASADPSAMPPPTQSASPVSSSSPSLTDPPVSSPSATITPPSSPSELPFPTTTEPEPPGEDSSQFSFVVIPDTQTWTGARDPRFGNATDWIASQEESLNIEWVQHTGDVVNWGWLDRTQYDVASKAMENLERADIPYAAAIGNHDTRVVGIGGGSYVFQNDKKDCRDRFGADECKAALLNRHTEEFNEYFTADRYGNVAGEFEAGKVDNIFQTFDAGNRKWLVLTLELWPRTEAIEWANGVVAQHPDHNVIVQTHSYLNGDGSIYTGNDYGSNSPQYLYDNLISRHDNIKMVFSGHVGQVGHRTDTTPSGNVVHSFLMNSVGAGNSVRIMTVDTETGEFSSEIYNESTDTWAETRRITGQFTVG